MRGGGGAPVSSTCMIVRVPACAPTLVLFHCRSACGVQTNGDNEVWNLAKDAVHYDAIVAVMNLREVRVCAGAGARRRADWEVGGVWLCSSRPML